MVPRRSLLALALLGALALLCIDVRAAVHSGDAYRTDADWQFVDKFCFDSTGQPTESDKARESSHACHQCAARWPRAARPNGYHLDGPMGLPRFALARTRALAHCLLWSLARSQTRMRCSP